MATLQVKVETYIGSLTFERVKRMYLSLLGKTLLIFKIVAD